MVSMNRQLAKAHPIHTLMAPHFEGTALINWGADEASLTETVFVCCLCGVRVTLRKVVSGDCAAAVVPLI